MRVRNRQKVVVGNPPKAFVGVAMAGLGMGMNIVNGIKAKREAERAALKSERNALTMRKSQDALELEDYPEEGFENVNYYQAGGGTIPSASFNTLGGDLNKVSSDMEVAKGNTHESSQIDNTSGIKLIQGNKAVAEIENNETIKDGNLVYSDRLKASNGKTFAQNAQKLARQKAKAEKRLGKGDSISKATTERRVGMIDQAENALFMEQEAYKEANGIEDNDRVPKAAFGATLGKIGSYIGKNADKAVPFIDNIANSFITKNMTPKVPEPSYLKPRRINTNVNVNPQLNAINDAVGGASRAIIDNTSNSNTARNNVASVRLRGGEQRAGILANKENQETQLKNQNVMMQQRTEAINNGLRDNFNMQNVARQGQIKSELSSNFSNMAGDFTDMINNKRDEKYNAETLAAFKTAYDKNGIVDRSDESMMKWMELMMKKKNGGKIRK